VLATVAEVELIFFGGDLRSVSVNKSEWDNNNLSGATVIENLQT
jgi:hypothetical protein